jgi:hypothetical protein
MTTNPSVPTEPPTDVDSEISAISAVYAALRQLDSAAQTRVLNYVAMKLGISPTAIEDRRPVNSPREAEDAHAMTRETQTQSAEEPEDELGISPVARKWMSRNGLTPEQLSAIFSIGADEIDLVAKSVPGESKRERMRNVILLKGIAAYLATGAARFGHEQMKETCLHYDAFDVNNFYTYFKALSSEVSGDRRAGYTLTVRGITSGTELIKRMVGTT